VDLEILRRKLADEAEAAKHVNRKELKEMDYERVTTVAEIRSSGAGKSSKTYGLSQEDYTTMRQDGYTDKQIERFSKNPSDFNEEPAGAPLPEGTATGTKSAGTAAVRTNGAVGTVGSAAKGASGTGGGTKSAGATAGKVAAGGSVVKSAGSGTVEDYMYRPTKPEVDKKDKFEEYIEKQ
jgi:hypothetical protein